MKFRFFAALLGLSSCMLLLGCGAGATDTSSTSDAVHDHATEHSHATEGPHGGHLIVLGEEEYHAELTHDEATHMVAVYLLDATAKETLSSGPAEITLQIFKDGDFVDYVLKASEDAGGFAVVDEPLCDFLLHAESVKGRVQAAIAGKQYVGIIELAGHDEHDHDTEGSGHDHDEPSPVADDAGHEGHDH